MFLASNFDKPGLDPGNGPLKSDRVAVPPPCNPSSCELHQSYRDDYEPVCPWHTVSTFHIRHMVCLKGLVRCTREVPRARVFSGVTSFQAICAELLRPWTIKMMSLIASSSEFIRACVGAGGCSGRRVIGWRYRYQNSTSKCTMVLDRSMPLDSEPIWIGSTVRWFLASPMISRVGSRPVRKCMRSRVVKAAVAVCNVKSFG